LISEKNVTNFHLLYFLNIARVQSTNVLLVHVWKLPIFYRFNDRMQPFINFGIIRQDWESLGVLNHHTVNDTMARIRQRTMQEPTYSNSLFGFRQISIFTLRW